MDFSEIYAIITFMINRYLRNVIESKIGDGKIIIILGARQVGKTTLLKSIFQGDGVLWLNGDYEETRTIMEHASPQMLGNVIGNNRVVVIDEAQRIPDIGIKLKIMQDSYGDKVQIIATGSSALELANKINEPLTGRKWEYRMFPLSFCEVSNQYGLIYEKSNLRNRMMYGYYPDVVTHPETAEQRLLQLVEDNLYKDILTFDGLQKSTKISNLLQALAFQIGSQVSVNELANTVGLDNKTVDKYLSLLEKAYIIFRLPSYARNLRNELKVSSKYFFYDVGVRNAVIGDFRPIDLRQDVGNLFENFIIAELQKNVINHRQYFWRTKQGQEVDYISINNEQMTAMEIKWSEKRNPRLPSVFIDEYNPAQVYYVNRDNFHEVLLNSTGD